MWLHEGAAELVGYHVLGDRHLGYSTYPNLLLTEKTIDEDRAAGSPYALYMVAVGRLVATAPGGLPALAAYYHAIAAGRCGPTPSRARSG